MNDSFDLLDDVVEEDNVELDEIDLMVEERESSFEDVEYPCVRIEGLASEEEFLFFKRKGEKVKEPLPLYTIVDDVMTRVGQFELSVSSLLSIRNIADYKLFLVVDKGTEKEIDLNDPLVIMKFINFKEVV